MKRQLRCWHRSLALIPAAMLVLWVLAGCALLWQEKISRPRIEIPETGRQAALEKVLAAAWQVYPRQSGDWRLRLPGRRGEAIQVLYVADDPFAGPSEPVSIWIDPRCAQVLQLTEGRGEIPGWLYRFHSTLLLGDKGRFGVIGLGLLMGALLGTGLALWRPSRRGLAGFHNWLGVAIAPPLLISLVSGLALALPQGWVFPSNEAEAAVEEPVPIKTLTLDDLVLWTRKLFPAATLREVAIPRWEDDPWELALRRLGAPDVEPAWVRVWLDPRQGRMAVQDPLANWRGRLRQWVYALHSGALAGTLGRVVLLLGGCGLALQAVVGLGLRFRRRRRRQGLAKSPAQPSPRPLAQKS